MLYPLSYVPSTFFEYNTSCRKCLVNASKFDRQSPNPLTDAGSTRPRERVSGSSRSLRLQILTIIVKIIRQ
jgi:hypothetical protein